MPIVKGIRIIISGASLPSDNIEGNYTFEFPSSTKASAGVFDSNGKLIRNLFSAESYSSGQHTENWDGLDNSGIIVPDGEYEIKVINGEISEEWEGAYIGNSSGDKSGAGRFRAFDFQGLQSVFVYGSNVFVASGYAEGWPSEFRFSTTTENNKTWVGKTGITGLNSQFVCTDGTIVYWAGFDPFQPGGTIESLVWGSNYTTNAQIAFSSGVNAHMEWDNTSSVTYKAISYKNVINSVISGLAVQKTGNYLFVARAALNEIQVLNKSTGALVQTVTITSPSYIGVDNSDNLWITTNGNLITKYTVDSGTGSLTITGISISSISLVGGFSFSPDSTTIAVCDITNQVVKGFSTSAGTLSWTLGTSGGYLTDSTVTNTKFYFKDVRNVRNTAIAYLADGSFYVNDPGNYRLQKYNSDRSFNKSIMMNAGNYRCMVDKETPTRVFADYMEFEIDYDDELSATTGWTLKKNWGANITNTYFSTYRMQNIVTFPNGRTYARLMINGVTYELIELVNNGVVRYTGVMLGQYGFLNLDGSKMVVESNSIYKKYALTGYDGSNNPIWSGSATTLSSPSFNSLTDPRIYPNNYETPITDSGNLIYFNCARVDASVGNEYHLAAVENGGTSFLWKAARGTQRSYEGEFPRDGSFDNGNGVQSDNRAGGSISIYGDLIFWGYRGEFWKDSQTNMWNVVDGNTGLLVHQFGALKSDYPNIEAPEKVAGNVFGGTVVEVDGNVYLYHNDEGINNGVHRWKINNLESVTIQNAVFPTSDEAYNRGTNLLEGIVRGTTTLINNTNGWTRNPTTDITGSTVTVGNLSYNKFKPADLWMNFNKPTGNSMTVSRDLGTNTGLTSWSIKGKVNYKYNNKSEFNLSAASFLDVVDSTGRQIARFDFRQAANQSGNYVYRGNDIVLTGGIIPQVVSRNRNEYFEISYSSGTITFKYADFVGTTSNKADVLADATNPKYFRFYAYTSGFQTPKYVSIQEMYFKNN